MAGDGGSQVVELIDMVSVGVMIVCWSTTALLLLLLFVFVEVVVMLLLRLMFMWNVCLHAVLLLQLEILLVQGVDTVNHDLAQRNYIIIVET